MCFGLVIVRCRRFFTVVFDVVSPKVMSVYFRTNCKQGTYLAVLPLRLTIDIGKLMEFVINFFLKQNQLDTAKYVKQYF